MPGLRSLASSKIHCVNSTAKGEIAYARYVYAYTSKDDTTIRAPVASFWATRSHTLRAEAEEEFRSLCLEYPQFGYDVLSMSFPYVVTGLLLTVHSSRPRREAQAGAQREASPFFLNARKHPQACAPQPDLKGVRNWRLRGSMHGIPDSGWGIFSRHIWGVC